MELQDLKKAMLTRPKDFGYFGDLDLSVWGFSPIAQNRDSDLLEQSNFAKAVEVMRNKHPHSVQVERFGHWACGWIEQLMVKTSNKRAMQTLLELLESLEDYPVLDEEDLGNREAEQAYEAYDSWAFYEVRKLVQQEKIVALLDEYGDYAPSEEQEEKIRVIVRDAILDYNPDEGTYDEESLRERLIRAFSK